MAHKTMVGGTAYQISSGKSMVNGTVYTISGGRTLVNGTGYDISFKQNAYAMLYSDGDLIFQKTNSVETGKTLVNSYSNLIQDSAFTIPWTNERDLILNVSFKEKISPKVFSSWFLNCTNLQNFNSTNLDLNKITTMNSSFYGCTNLSGEPICGPNTTGFSGTYAYSGIDNFICGNNVIYMNNAYRNVRTSKDPVCGEKVQQFAYAYANSLASNNAACGSQVTNMQYAYYNCRRITQAACGDNVVNMAYSYWGCTNLKNSFVCGNKVTDMSFAYYNCNNRIKSPPVCGASVKNMYYAYGETAANMSGNAYFYSSQVNNATLCLRNKSNSYRLNIYVPANSTTLSTIIRNTTNFCGPSTNFTKTNSYYRSSRYNVYLYPVDDVAAIRAANGD